MGGGHVTQGKTAFAQLRFDKPATAFAGQRMILRSLSPAQTIGGAVVLDPQARGVKTSDATRLAVMQAATNGDTVEIAKALCAQGRACVELSDVTRIAGQSPEDVLAMLGAEFESVDTGWIAMAATIKSAQENLLQRLQRYHAEHPIKLFAPRNILVNRDQSPRLAPYVERRLAKAGAIRVVNDQISMTSHDPAAALTTIQRDRMADIERQIKDGGTLPPSLGTILQESDDHDLLALLVAEQKVVPLTNFGLNRQVVFHAQNIAQAVQTLRQTFPPPMSFTTGQGRAVLQTSRKFIVPLLEYFDATGVTHRQGDTRQMAAPEY